MIGTFYRQFSVSRLAMRLFLKGRIVDQISSQRNNKPFHGFRHHLVLEANIAEFARTV